MSITVMRNGALSRASAPTPAARRQRRHRARSKQGRFVVPVEVTREMITALVDHGDVDEATSSDPDRVGEAIAAAARRNLKLKGDIQSPEFEVCFTPNNGHSEAHAGLPVLTRRRLRVLKRWATVTL